MTVMEARKVSMGSAKSLGRFDAVDAATSPIPARQRATLCKLLFHVFTPKRLAIRFQKTQDC